MNRPAMFLGWSAGSLLRKMRVLALGGSLLFLLGGSLRAGTDDIAAPLSNSDADAKASLTKDADAWWNGEYLTGDWGGERTQLEAEGVDFYLYYVSITADNPVGGRYNGGWKYAQDVNPGVTLDMQKLTGWDGATININGVSRAGHTVRPQVGSIYDPVQIYGGQTYTLYNVTLEQKFAGDLGAIKIGRLSAGDDFAVSPLYNYYLNNGIDGQIRAVVFDTNFFTYPFATWGGRLRFDPSPEFNVQTGVYEASNHINARYLHGVDFGIGGTDGFLVMQQFGWTPTFDKDGTAPSTGLPGHYFVGGYWSNSDYRQYDTSVHTRISYGFYAHGDQMVYRAEPGSDVGLTLLGTVACSPQPDVSLVPFQLAGGALYQGLVPDRPNDMTIFGVIYGELSDDYADAVSANGGGRPTYETDLELGYRVQFSQFLYLQPAMQYIFRPGGTGDIPDALVIGAQMGLTF